MKGIIFNAVESAVVSLFDEDTWDDLLDAADLTGDYTSIGTYDDADLLALVGAAVEATGQSADDLIRTLGTHAFAHLVERHPEFVDGITGLHQFLRTVDEIIHPEVMKLHPDSRPPRFECEDIDSQTLRMTYRSERKLGVLAEGLILGAGEWFGQPATIELVSGAGEATTVYDIKV